MLPLCHASPNENKLFDGSSQWRDWPNFTQSGVNRDWVASSSSMRVSIFLRENKYLEWLNFTLSSLMFLGWVLWEDQVKVKLNFPRKNRVITMIYFASSQFLMPSFDDCGTEISHLRISDRFKLQKNISSLPQYNSLLEICAAPPSWWGLMGPHWLHGSIVDHKYFSVVLF